jgi:hypothetical protein
LALAYSLTALDVIARDDGAGVADVDSFTDIQVVPIGQEVGAGGVHAARHGRSAPGKDEHDVFAELGQLALITRSEAFAKAYQQQQGPHTPGDTEHGQAGAQFVRPKRAEDLREDVQQHAHDLGHCTVSPLKQRRGPGVALDSLVRGTFFAYFVESLASFAVKPLTAKDFAK